MPSEPSVPSEPSMWLNVVFFFVWMWQKEMDFAELWDTRVVHPTLQNICIVAGFLFWCLFFF